MCTGKLTDGIIPIMNPVLPCLCSKKIHIFEIMGLIIHIPK
jgi:hypothetical protein